MELVCADVAPKQGSVSDEVAALEFGPEDVAVSSWHRFWKFSFLRIPTFGCELDRVSQVLRLANADVCVTP